MYSVSSLRRLCSTLQPRLKTIRGARFTAVGGAAAVQTVASQHLNNAWQPRAGLVASANPIRNTCLHPDHIGTLGIGTIHIEGLTLTMLGKQTMKSLLFIVAFAIGLLAFLVATQPVSAARGWWSWPNSGYCPSGTCNKLGGWKASNVKNCSAANCLRH